SPIAGPERDRGLGPLTINAPNQPICSVPCALNLEPAPRWFFPSATARLCSFISTRSPPRLPPAPTPSSSSIRPAGTEQSSSRSRTTSPPCRCHRAHPNSTARKTSGSSCARIGSQTASSNPSTISSITAATPGTPSSISLGRSCPSLVANGHSSVNHHEVWYKLPSLSAPASDRYDHAIGASDVSDVRCFRGV